jgi:rod shape-determining protein MreC
MWIWTHFASACSSTRVRSDGVYVGQAVLDAGGVFGQVARVDQLTSEVILISDAAHAIPVQVNRNGLRTMAVGTGDMSRLKLPYISTAPTSSRAICW